MLPHTAVQGVRFPPIPGDLAARLLALQFQFRQSERWPEATVRERQFQQIAAVIAHCHAHIPFMRARLALAGLRAGVVPTEKSWARLPVLTRRDVQEAGASLRSNAPPAEHGDILKWMTSGSTGTPVEGLRTQLAHQFWMAFNLRDLLWHPVSPDAKLAIIRRDRSGRAAPPHGCVVENWGPSLSSVYPTGPAVLLDNMCTTEEQVAWLRREAPAHLVTFPGIAALLARHCLDHGVTFPGLRDVRTFGETPPEGLRDLIRDAWGAELVESYSTEEVGFVALQCPDHPHFHAQSENALVEILRDDGTPCAVGESGRVVVTTLHNFAMPLLRYDLGDIAERGPPCPCGRTLPVLGRVLGKIRHMLVLPDGSRRFTNAATKAFGRQKAIIQGQIAQTALNALEIRVVARRALETAEERTLVEDILNEMGTHFVPSVVYMADLPRSPVGKFHTFVRECP